MDYGHINTSDFTDEETLFFIRVKGKEHFFDTIYGKGVMQEAFGHIKNFKTFSEYKNADHYIDLSKIQVSDLSYDNFSVYNKEILDDLHSIIFRCRGLRAIPFYDAKQLTILCAKYFIDFFKNNHYKLVVIHIIDNYVLDIMYRIAKSIGIEVIVMSEFFILGYRRHTIYGEYNYMQEPTKKDIAQTIAYFKKKEKSFWLKGVDKMHNIKFCIYLVFSYYARYISRYLIGYKVFGNLSYEYRFAHLFTRIPLKNFIIGKYFTKLSNTKIRENLKNSIYLPLHVYPEANVDYWIENPNNADYYSSIYEALAFFREKNIDVYIKEHPGFLYQRDPEVYKVFNSFTNAKLIHPFDKDVELIDDIPNIIVWLGSTGVEGLMQDKRVVVFDKNYYSENFVKNIADYSDAVPMDQDTKEKFIKYILTGVVKFEVL